MKRLSRNMLLAAVALVILANILLPKEAANSVFSLPALFLLFFLLSFFYLACRKKKVPA